MRSIKLFAIIAAFIVAIMVSTKVYAEDYVVPVTASGHTYTVTIHVEGKVTGVEATKGLTVGEPKLVVTPTLEIAGSFAKQYPDALKNATMDEDEFRGLKFYTPATVDWAKQAKTGKLTEGIYLGPYVGSDGTNAWIVNIVSAVFFKSPLPRSYTVKSVIFLVDGKRVPLDINKLEEAVLSKGGSTLNYSMINLEKADLDQLRQIATAKKASVQVLFADAALTAMVRTLSEEEKQYIGQALAIYELLGGK